MSDTTSPQEAAESGLSSRSLFGLRVFDRDILHHAQIMADQVTKPSGMTFAEIAEKAWQSRPKHGKICGAETFRFRAFEHLQNAVHCGKLRKEGKIYLPNPNLNNAPSTTTTPSLASMNSSITPSSGNMRCQMTK